MNKFDEWLEEYKHLGGQHNQKKHGFRGGTAVSHAAQTGDGIHRSLAELAQQSGKDVAGVSKIAYAQTAPKKAKIDTSKMGSAKEFMKDFMESTGLEPGFVVKQNNGFDVHVDGKLNATTLSKRLNAAMPAGYTFKTKIVSEPKDPNETAAVNKFRMLWYQVQIRPQK